MFALTLLLLMPKDVIPLAPETGPTVTFKDCYHGILPSSDRPKGVVKAPERADRWYAFPWGEGTAVVAADEKRLWPDRDGDGDLAEEESVARPEPYKSVELSMRLPLPSRTVEARLRATFVWEGQMRLVNLTRMSGRLPVGDREMAVSLTDYFANGRYDDVYTTKTAEYWLCDHVHLDVGGDGKFRDRIPPSGEDFSLARRYVLGDAVYSFEVLDRGESIRFSKLDVALATVNVNVPKFTVALLSDDYGACHLTGATGTARLPEGRYRFEYCDWEFDGARVDGNWWKEDGERFLDIKDGMDLRLKGDLRYEVFHERGEGGALAVWTICFGPNGERVEVTPKGADNNVEPEVVVIEDGKELLRVTSHYC